MPFDSLTLGRYNRPVNRLGERNMKSRLPLGLKLVAALQFLAPLILPPDALAKISPVLWVIVVLLFALLGWSLLRRQAWSRVATVFIQGFNIIVRLLYLVGHALQGGRPGNPVDVWLLGTSFLSMLLSGLILYYVDLPDIHVLMQSA